MACRTSLAAALAIAASLLVVGGCAAPTVDAQWTDPQRPPSSLRGTKVMVVCQASELVLRRICQDQFSAQLTALGAIPVVGPDGIEQPGGQAAPDERYLSAARTAGATAILSAAIAPASTNVSQGFSIGIGGFGIGGGGGGVGGGISAPIGGGQVTTGYAANSSITDVASGRLVWTAKTNAPPSSDVNAQLAELAKTALGAAATDRCNAGQAERHQRDRSRLRHRHHRTHAALDQTLFAV